MRVNKNQSGIAHLGVILLGLIIVVVVGFSFWWVKHHHSAQNLAYTDCVKKYFGPGAHPVPCTTPDGVRHFPNGKTEKLVDFNDCKKAGYPVTEGYPQYCTPLPDGGRFDREWTPTSGSDITLSKWNVKITIPAELRDRAVVGSEYVFSTTKVLNDPKCIEYFQNSQSPPGLSIDRSLKTAAAETSIVGSSAGSGNLEDYYNRHKVSGTNYFIAPDSAIKYYLVGDYFYSTGADPEKYRQERLQNCAQETTDFYTLFIQAVSTIRLP